MTWEIVAGVTALIATVISVLTVAVKINRTLVLLEAAVERLGKLTEAQNEKKPELREKAVGMRPPTPASRGSEGQKKLLRRIFGGRKELSL